jgi:hypothetical protein
MRGVSRSRFEQGDHAEEKDVPALSDVAQAVSAQCGHRRGGPGRGGAGEFITQHGIAIDSRGDIHVAEVSITYWAISYGKKPDHELRSFQNLVKVS